MRNLMEKGFHSLSAGFNFYSIFSKDLEIRCILNTNRKEIYENHMGFM